MDVTRNVEAAPWSTRLVSAATQIELAAKIAMACVFLSWFFLDTLVANLGSLQHGIRFFDVSAVIADPSRIFFGFSGWAQRIGFGLLCLACLLAPVLPHLRRERSWWLAYLAPAVLMAVCGVLLLWRTSGQFIAAPNDAGHIAGTVTQFANELMHHGSALITRHVSIGVGGYLGFVSSFVLALRGVRHYRREHRPQQAA
jgi:hypothetical protein